MGENLRRFRAFGSAAERRDVGIHGGDLSGGSVTFVGITLLPARERFGQRRDLPPLTRTAHNIAIGANTQPA